jgi:hypothetical protein
MGFSGVVWCSFGLVITLELLPAIRDHFFFGLGFLAVFAAALNAAEVGAYKPGFAFFIAIYSLLIQW